MTRNIFVIPSWYPSQKLPLSGTFIKEQSIAISKHNPHSKIIISLRSDRDFVISKNEYIKLAGAITNGTFKRVEVCQLRDNVYEISSPAFTLNRIKTVVQDKTRLLALTERNLKFSFKHFGKIDLIHAHVGYPGGYIAGILSRQYKIPYVITEHMSNFPFQVMLKNNQLIDELQFAYANCSKSISVSSSAANQIESYNIKRPTVIPNMVDEDIFKPADNNYTQKDHFIFLTVGGLIPRKGHKELLEAISLWKTKPSNIKFKIIGEGPLFSDLINLGKELNIQNQVEWLGALSRNEIVNEFKNCDVFVLPSHLESFGIVYTEALACGKPVIATKCGGPEEIINKNNGILVDVGNSYELSNALKFLYDNIMQYNAEIIRNHFIENFSTKSISKKIISLFEEVINNYSI